MKELGFLFFNKNDQLFSKNALKNSNEMKKELMVATTNFPPYSNDLNFMGILNEEDYIEKVNFNKLLIENSNISLELISEYYLYFKSCMFLENYWFLKPALFLDFNEIEDLAFNNHYFDNFLNDPLANAHYFDFLTQIDGNYDYFIIPKNEGLKLFVKLCSFESLTNKKKSVFENIDETLMVIKKWR